MFYYSANSDPLGTYHRILPMWKVDTPSVLDGPPKIKGFKSVRQWSFYTQLRESMFTRYSCSTHRWAIIITPYTCRLHISCDQSLMESKREVVDSWKNHSSGKLSLPKTIHGLSHSKDSASSSSPCSCSLYCSSPHQKIQALWLKVIKFKVFN